MNRWVKVLTVLLIIVLCFGLVGKVSSAPTDTAPLKALIVDGQDNHDWKRSSQVFKQILEQTGLFKVDVATSPPHGGDMENFKPNFAVYDVVVINYNGDTWPEQTKKAFVEYVKSGGGVAVQHSADNSFPEWKEYNEIIGLGGWGDRDEKDGPYVYWKDGRIVRDMSPGDGGTHGAERAYQIINRNTEHPITRGLPEKWMHARDELYAKLRGPAKNLTILSTGHSNVSGKEEPLLFTINYGKGRVFHTVLGHNPYGGGPWPPLECVGFITTFQRGAEWAATGKVTQKVPEDFPTATEVRRWKSYKPPSLDELLGKIASYEYGKSRASLYKLDEYLRSIGYFPEELKRYEQHFISFLQSDATLDGKLHICRKLSIIGTEAAVPTLAKMLTNEETSDMARFALERIPATAVDEALRKALRRVPAKRGPKATGKTKVGIINSLGQRRDGKSVAALKNLIYDSDITTAVAAVAALGQIANSDATSALAEAKNKTTGKVRLWVLDAYLKCADKFLANGDTDSAMEIYRRMYKTSGHTPTRVAALRGVIAAEPDELHEVIDGTLTSGDVEMLTAAIALVGEIPEIPDLRYIAAELPNLPAAQQVQLLSAVGERADPVVLPDVINAIRSTEESVRIAALKAIGKLGGASHVSSLAQIAATTTGAERDAARESFYTLRGPKVDQTILTNIPLAAGERKVELIRSIGRRNITTGVETLLKTAKDQDRNVRMESLKVLRAVAGPKNVPALVELLITAESDAELREAERTLASASRNAVSESTNVILDALASAKDLEARCSLLAVLGKIGGNKALGVLMQALKDNNAEVQTAAIRALSEWPTAEPMTDLLKIVQSSDNKIHRTLALRGFVRLVGLESDRPLKETIKMYKQAMTLTSNVREKKMVLSALANVRAFAALKMAADYLDDSALQQEAAAAIVKIADATADSHPEQTRMMLRKVIEISKSESLREWAQELLNELE